MTMPKITIRVNEYDLKLIRRIARHEHRSVPMTAGSLVNMSLQMVRTEERTGLYYGPTPKQDRPPKKMPVQKPPSRFAGWTTFDRELYVLTGLLPAAAAGKSRKYLTHLKAES